MHKSALPTYRVFRSESGLLTLVEALTEKNYRSTVNEP